MTDTPASRAGPPAALIALFEAFAEPAALIEPDGALVRVNARFAERFGAGQWAGRALDEILSDPLDRHLAPWRRMGKGAETLSAPVRSASGEVFAARITLKPLSREAGLVTISAAAEGTEHAALAEMRLDLAAGAAGLSPWRYDFDAAEGWLQGPLADPAGFGPAVWRGRVHPDDLASLTAAFLALEFGAGFDHRYRVRGGDGGWCWRRACGVREPGFGPRGRRASGFLIDEGQTPGGAEADPAEAAASAQMSAWTFELATRRLRITGPVLGRLGLPTPVTEFDILDWRARVPEGDHGAMDRATQELEQRGVTEVEYRVRAADGELVWLTLRGGVSEQDADGAVLRYSGFLSEVSPRKLLERRFAERERELSEAVEAGLVGIWFIDLRTGRQTVQGRLAGWMRAGPDGVVAREHWREIIHPDDFERAFEAFKAVAAGQAFGAFEYRLRDFEGWRWARTNGRIVETDPAGRPLRAAGVVIDISAERAFADALQVEKQRFETVYRDTPAMMQSIDTFGRTLMVSDYWLSRTGYSRDEALGAPLCAFFTPEDGARLREEIVPRSLETGIIRNEPLTALSKSGVPIEVRLSAFWERDREGRPLRAHGVFAEVGDLNQARRELESRNTELERVNRELGRFTTVASHDLQEPLRKISAFASLLRRTYAGRLDSDADQSLEYLVDAAGRMRLLIDDLLAYSRASSRTLAPEAIDLGDVFAAVQEGQDLQIAEAEARIEAADLPVVFGDRVLLRLLFANLLSNALKYRKGPGVRIKVSGAASDGQARIVFEDDGIGFDPGFAQKVFEPFARLHAREDYEGTGIGLAICQQAVERLGGTIGVDTAPGRGARFTITLPGARPERAAGAA